MTEPQGYYPRAKSCPNRNGGVIASTHKAPAKESKTVERKPVVEKKRRSRLKRVVIAVLALAVIAAGIQFFRYDVSIGNIYVLKYDRLTGAMYKKHSRGDEWERFE